MIARPNWTARFAGALLLLLAGAALATWALARSAPAARLFGVAPSVTVPLRLAEPQPVVDPTPLPQEAARLAAVEGRLATVESATLRAQGSAGRADALLVAFAARRAVDRGLALGYLEPLLVQRFGPNHQAAVSTIVTASRDPVRLDSLAADYEGLGPALRSGGREEGWWASLRRELGSIVAVHHADRPSPQPQARYDRALGRIRAGQVDAALAETMRLPGAAGARDWVYRARRYVLAHRALDEIESAALLGDGQQPRPTIANR